VAPTLQSVWCGRFFDRLEVGLAPGQTPSLFEDASESLAHVFGVASCRVRRLRPGLIVLELGHSEALTGIVTALPISESVDLREVPVGVTERGTAWTLPVLGSHLLVVGMTHAGKSSVIWSLLRGLASPIAAGSVRVVCMDPKGGMELAAGAAMFSRFETDFDSIADALDQAVELMAARTARLRGVTRALEPSIEEPLVVIVVDELASLTAYQPDRKLRDRINNALALLCTQGRAAGVCVVAAVQDPRKEVVSVRDLFPTKVALRLGSANQVEMILGDGARARGARCDEIARSTPGIGYVLVEGEVEPVRVRAAYVSDDDIAVMAAGYPAPLVLEEQP
jgi:S-DNA-T family DNA segregation ATPase FtsK/SpoIIIE